jgi:hypothetical protein
LCACAAGAGLGCAGLRSVALGPLSLRWFHGGEYATCTVLCSAVLWCAMQCFIVV